jgi:hypothetical protein
MRSDHTIGTPRVSRMVVAVPAAIAAIALGACGSSSQASSGAPELAATSPSTDSVTVSPLPGTPDASAQSQISFLGGPGTQVADVQVVGSRSGRHSGQLRPYSTGTGESFLPTHPFLTGEKVTVRARVGTSSVDQTVSSTFTIAQQASVNEREFPTKAGDPAAVQHYSSAPSLTPSTVKITTAAKPGGAAGDLFLAPYQGHGSPGPMIVNQNGSLVWFHPLPAGQEATNFQVQSYEGKPVLTWWQGRIIEVGFGQGEDLLYDSSYRPVARVRAGNGYHADLHEIRLTAQGTAWIDAFDPIHMDLSGVHGAHHGILTDSVIQEVDIKTGLVMWEWHALGHIPLQESNNPVPSDGYPWDYVHINSVDPGSSGDVLLSSRNTWTLYDVDLHTGSSHWRLGGKHSSFAQGAGTKFYWQHDAEFQPGGEISLFDNGSDPPKEKQSRGLLLRVDPSARKVTLAQQFTNPKTLLASSQGNILSLPGGNWLLGYGGLPNFTEFDSAGHVLLDGTLGKDVQNFRTYLSPWTGQPLTAPAVLAQTHGGAINVEASWNGATDVASWRVLAGSSPTTLVPATTAASSGFQTSIAVAAGASFVSAQALDSAGQTLGSSAAVKVTG